MSSPFTVLILTEDKAGWEVVQKIVREAFHMIDSTARLDPESLWSRPADATARAARGSNWKSTSERDEPNKRALIREITTHLLRPRGFVVFHFDGDEAWSQRARSVNVAKWENFCLQVQQNVQQRVKEPDLVLKALSKLLRVTPFYCVESWLYCATDSLLAECSVSHAGKHHEAIFERAQDKAKIEEIVQPWSVWCAGKTTNERLVRGVSFEELYYLQQSFYETVERLMECAELIEALKSVRI